MKYLENKKKCMYGAHVKILRILQLNGLDGLIVSRSWVFYGLLYPHLYTQNFFIN